MRLDAAGKYCDRRRFGKPVPGNGVRRKGEGQLDAIANLVRREILDRDRNRRRGRNRLTWCAAPIRKQENGKQKTENREGVSGASFEVNARPFSIFHFPISGATGCSG